MAVSNSTHQLRRTEQSDPDQFPVLFFKQNRSGRFHIASLAAPFERDPGPAPLSFAIDDPAALLPSPVRLYIEFGVAAPMDEWGSPRTGVISRRAEGRTGDHPP